MGINTGNSKTHGNRQNTVHGVIKGVPKSQIIPTNMVKLDQFIQNVSNSKQIQYCFEKVNVSSKGAVGIHDNCENNQVNDTQKDF